MSDPVDEADVGDPEGEVETWVDRWVAPYVRESTLWPVAIVLIAHFALGLSLAILSAVRSPAGFGTLALALLVVMTGSTLIGDLRRRRFGIISGLLVVIWVLGGLAAWIADRTGIY